VVVKVPVLENETAIVDLTAPQLLRVMENETADASVNHKINH